MIDIEIPYKQDRGFKYRLFEIMPGAISWFFLFLPLILSLINVTFASVFILAYLLIFFVRSIGVNVRAFQGYATMSQHRKLPWRDMLTELETGKLTGPDVKRPRWHLENIEEW